VSLAPVSFLLSDDEGSRARAEAGGSGLREMGPPTGFGHHPQLENGSGKSTAIAGAIECE
jgi:hypothetical protein